MEEQAVLSQQLNDLRKRKAERESILSECIPSIEKDDAAANCEARFGSDYRKAYKELHTERKQREQNRILVDDDPLRVPLRRPPMGFGYPQPAPGQFPGIVGGPDDLYPAGLNPHHPNHPLFPPGPGYYNPMQPGPMRPRFDPLNPLNPHPDDPFRMPRPRHPGNNPFGPGFPGFL